MEKVINGIHALICDVQHIIEQSWSK